MAWGSFSAGFLRTLRFLGIMHVWDRHLFAPAVEQHLAQVGVRAMRDTDLLVGLTPPSHP
jgi:hypothetical protein